MFYDVLASFAERRIIDMKKLLFAVTGCFLMAFCSITNPVVVKADEAVWYEDLPTASTAEELFEHTYFPQKTIQLKSDYQR